MSSSGKSLFYFGIYVVIAGILFLCCSNSLLDILHLPTIAPGWAGVIGLLALVIGIYDIILGKANNYQFITASVYVRLIFTLGIFMLVFTGRLPWTIILFGSVDALGALWTFLALKSEKLTAKN